ncbi:hypothetical protein HYT05_01440, partial [Candidatus Kaiserbacteria bacterium]|nr:hypothetical protein [Candidatus Kaiserbacteria bacterium]
DLGATVTDDHDNNLGIHTYVNGAEVQEVSLDTSSSTTYTIHYRVTDTDGNISEEHRVVVVGGDKVSEEVVAPPEEAAPVETATSMPTLQSEAASVQKEQVSASDPLPPPAAASEPEAQTVPPQATPADSVPSSESATL